jgi:hypothetical protein
MPGKRLRYCLLLLFLANTAFAQFFYFGRNKVQYTNFDWQILKTEHFDIYYDRPMEDLARRGAFFAEESYALLETQFNHNIANRVPLIFYSSHLLFQQTNVTGGFIPEGVGGFFEYLKGRVVIPYDGSTADFRHVIRHELVHVFMHSKISRILADHRIAADHLPPLWFTEGLAEYWSTAWDAQAEMVLRDATVSNYLVPLSDMDRIFGTYLMYKEGQEILGYVAREYGDETVLRLMDNFWKSPNFEEVFRITTGRNYEAFDREWTYALKKRYYPLLAGADQPSGSSAALVEKGFNSKPVVFTRGGQRQVYFIGNHSGYTSVMRASLDRPKEEPVVVVEGEKTDELEAFHLFQSKIDITRDGLLAFVTKSGENDALHLYDVVRDSMVETYHFADLVVIGSPSWSPDGTKLVFSAVDRAGDNDLYLWERASEHLTRLTNDVYDDRDPAWSPDGASVAFSSDRTAFGAGGSYNLFLYTLATHAIDYLTYGKESSTSPAWSPDGRALLFTSDRGGARNLWMMKLDSLRRPPAEIRRLTAFTTAAFDPAWADTSVVFVSFEDFSFQLRTLANVGAMYDTAAVRESVSVAVTAPPWRPSSLAGATEARPLRYEGEYSLDVAQSQISTDPVFGTNGGAFLAMSDLLGNHQYYFLLYNTAQTSSELLSSFNLAISSISLEKRTNYAYGIYRFSGRRYDLTDPDEYFFERVFGGYFTLNYPLSKFRRLGLLTSISNSEKDPDEQGYYQTTSANIDRSRRALFLSNSVSFTHDNSLWGPSGPLDGSRFNITLGYTTDIQYSHASYYSVIADYRQYFRIAERSAYAVRLWLFYNDGKEARRFFMGGSWDLRGYPRWSLRGRKLWLMSQELRFPLLDALALRFPFGGLTFAGIRGAAFVDVGGVWDDQYIETRGSTGVGVRLNLLGALVLRYDVGKRIEDNLSHFQTGLFYQFFFGWDF